MTTSLRYSLFDVTYPDSDGLPMAESDATRDYLIYGVEALDSYFQENANVYVSGNLFIYYEQGNPKAVVAPDVFVVFGVEKKKRPSYKTWEEQGKIPDFVLEITSKVRRVKIVVRKEVYMLIWEWKNIFNMIRLLTI